jgi:hypothetical protein
MGYQAARYQGGQGSTGVTTNQPILNTGDEGSAGLTMHAAGYQGKRGTGVTSYLRTGGESDTGITRFLRTGRMGYMGN